ncbi:MAG: molybdate-binding protein, partial [Actinomycetota bacterium]|nr:molybdate-binding protein [Actinomycetota bacterium]
MRPVAAALVAALALSGCSTGDDEETLTVLAAASLTETFTELAEEFEAEHPGVR